MVRTVGRLMYSRSGIRMRLAVNYRKHLVDQIPIRDLTKIPVQNKQSCRPGEYTRKNRSNDHIANTMSNTVTKQVGELHYRFLSLCMIRSRRPCSLFESMFWIAWYRSECASTVFLSAHIVVC